MSDSILIVDDDKRLRELLEDYLIEKKFRVFSCDDFLSAKEILSYFLFDLIIVDRMMPGGDGINLIHFVNFSHTITTIFFCYIIWFFRIWWIQNYRCYYH